MDHVNKHNCHQQHWANCTHKEERSVSEDVTDDNDVTALTALLATEDKASKIDEYCSGEDVTQNKQERSRLMMSTDETRGIKSHQTDQQLQ